LALLPEEVEADAQLVWAVQAGDVEAFTELYQRHHSGIRRACLRQLLDIGEAEEVVQATFVRAYERIDQCTGPRHFGAWVHVIATRLCVDALRLRQRTKPEHEPITANEGITGGSSPEELLIDREDALVMRAALAALPERQRDVVIARDVDGRRPAEIAATLGISVGAVDSVLLRARRRLALLYNHLANERGAAASATSAAASLAGAAGLISESTGAGRRVVSALAGVAMTVVPLAHAADGPGRAPTGTPSGRAIAAVVAPAPSPAAGLTSGGDAWPVGGVIPTGVPVEAAPVVVSLDPALALPPAPVPEADVPVGAPLVTAVPHPGSLAEVLRQIGQALGAIPDVTPLPG
jgi:RNA polymerase sigma-70 factor (ECF subfamily)